MTTTTYSQELQLEISEWRVDLIDRTLEQCDEMSDIVSTIAICRNIIDLTDDEIVTLYLN